MYILTSLFLYFDYSITTAEQTFTKRDRKQVQNAIRQACFPGQSEYKGGQWYLCVRYKTLLVSYMVHFFKKYRCHGNQNTNDINVIQVKLENFERWRSPSLHLVNGDFTRNHFPTFHLSRNIQILTEIF